MLDRLWALWQVPLSPHISLEPLQRTAVTAMLLDAENIVARGYARATITHFTGDEAAYAHRLQAAMQADRWHVAEFAHKYVTRERARAVLVTPLPGRVTPEPEPEPEPEPTLALPLDEAPPSFDADAIHRYVHAPGVAAYRRVVLDNGLEVVIGRRTGLPIATVGLSLHGGAATAEPKGADNLARRLARPRFPRSVDAGYFGGHLLTRYERDQLVYTISAAAGNVANMLDVLSRRSQMMFVDSTVAKDFDRDVIPLVAKLELAPEVQAGRAFRAALFGAHPYGRTLAANEPRTSAPATRTTGWTGRPSRTTPCSRSSARSIRTRLSAWSATRSGAGPARSRPRRLPRLRSCPRRRRSPSRSSRTAPAPRRRRSTSAACCLRPAHRARATT